MLKIIKGRKYDTETATKICSYDNGLPSGDFDALCEQLYVKRTGEFFLYGYGGARTAYAEADGNMWTSGEKSFHFPKLTQRRSLKNTLHRKCTNSTSVKCQRVIPTEQQ